MGMTQNPGTDQALQDYLSAWATSDEIADICDDYSGCLTIGYNVVKSIAELIDGVILTNGERVIARGISENDDACSEISMEDFRPSMLPTKVQTEIRKQLRTASEAKKAVRLFNKLIRCDLPVAIFGAKIGLGDYYDFEGEIAKIWTVN